MEKDKISFLIYLSYEEHFNLLSDAELGQLLRAMMEYEKTGIVPELNGMVKMAFSFIKTQLDMDKEKWIEQKQKRSEAGKRGMTSRWEKDNNKNNNVITEDNKNNNVINVITRDNTA